MASSSYVIQQLIPTLAQALARLRRSPGRNEGWVADALRELERHDLPRFERMRRRIGFARRLGGFAHLGVQETATLTLGLFFHDLAEGQPARNRNVGGAWLEYLLRNEDWLAPAFEMSQAITSGEWEDLESKATIVVKVTDIYDTRTLDRRERPLQVIQQLMSDIESPSAQEVISLLWSEEGQALCDHHFRRHPRGYKLDASDLKGCFELLREVAPRQAPAEAAVAPFQLAGPGRRAADGERDEHVPAPKPAPKARPAARPATATPAGSNFDRRRQELRARAPFSFGEQTSAPPQRHINGQLVDKQPQQDALPEPPQAEEQPPAQDHRERRYEELEREDAPRVEREEDTMEQTRTISPLPAPARRREALDMIQKLQDVRLQLGQIQRVAIDAEQLLNGLAPQLDELAAWIVELDAVVERWRGAADVERAA